ncbi:hypothetical protein [Xylocopilactobacillus apis]|uniref:ABC transporter permease n=1 Tax=Xylocopilactobacillus apis TaxID=2932183 RepID=A0AAU9DLD0_9LACO|nr:hypothetical protein [Xylocopilactobacillus apis]BDR55613.1 hypothetical protein KIMC2_01750 [Xylocopilactobacillus apis]
MDFRSSRLLNSHWRMFLYFLYRSRFRIALLLVFEIIIGIVYKGDWLLWGIETDNNFKIVPITWLFMIMNSQFMVGDSCRQMVKKFYPTHIRFSLFQLMISVFVTSTFTTVIAEFIILLKIQSSFYLYTFLVIWALTISFGLLSIFIKPILLHFISILLLVVTTYLNWPHFMSSTMLVRYQETQFLADSLVLGAFLVAVLVITNLKMKKLDYTL